jgi:DNA-binding NtrC family response regulator
MVADRYPHDPTGDPSRPRPRPPADELPRDAAGRRLNVLITDRGQRWSSQLPRLLEPQGVRSFPVASADEALDLIHATPIHVAVVDLFIDSDPDHTPSPQRLPGGLKLLQIIQRIDRRPPAVMIVRSRHFDPRVDDFVLNEALRLNAFSVLDQPVELEQMLSVLRRALERYFHGQWPE